MNEFRIYLHNSWIQTHNEILPHNALLAAYYYYYYYYYYYHYYQYFYCVYVCVCVCLCD